MSSTVPLVLFVHLVAVMGSWFCNGIPGVNLFLTFFLVPVIMFQVLNLFL